MNEQLKRCPFCGSRAAIETIKSPPEEELYTVIIKCNNENIVCGIVQVGVGETEKDAMMMAVNKWEQRNGEMPLWKRIIFDSVITCLAVSIYETIKLIVN